MPVYIDTVTRHETSESEIEDVVRVVAAASEDREDFEKLLGLLGIELNPALIQKVLGNMGSEDKTSSHPVVKVIKFLKGGR